MGLVVWGGGGGGGGGGSTTKKKNDSISSKVSWDKDLWMVKTTELNMGDLCLLLVSYKESKTSTKYSETLNTWLLLS